MGKKLKQANNTNKRKEKQIYQKKKERNRFSSGEEREYAEQLAAYKAVINVMASDGNCLFRSLADQAEGNPHQHSKYRARIMDYIEENRDDFEPFLEDDEKWDDYVPRMRSEREWGGQLELIAAARSLKANIVIHQFQAPRWEILTEGAKKSFHISFHGGAHYNSVRAMDDPCRIGEPPMPLMLGTSPIKSSKKKKKKKKEKEEGDGQNEGEGEEASGDDEEGRQVKRNGHGKGKEDDDDDEEEDEEVEKGEEEEEEQRKKKVGGKCHCGSGKLYRKCHRKIERQREKLLLLAKEKEKQEQEDGEGVSYRALDGGDTGIIEDKVKALVL